MKPFQFQSSVVLFQRPEHLKFYFEVLSHFQTSCGLIQMGIWKSAVFESYPRNWLQKVKGPATAHRRKQWSSGPGGGSSSEMAKGPALREEVRSQVTSPKGPVSRPVPCSPKPEQRPWLAEAYPCPLLLIFRIYTLLFDHGNVVTICFYRKDIVRIISSL